MKRVLVYAHFDKKNIISDYVLFSLSEMKKVCDEIIFVSCCDLEPKELDKLYCHKIAKKHNEYDFGSYKRGFLYAKEHNLLNDCYELVFMNDSCFGPFKPMDKIFYEMGKSNCDFWGLTKNKFAFKIQKNRTKDCFIPHIQSYFLVLRPNLFNSESFYNFITSVKEEENKNSVIEKYEIGFTSEMEKNGFVSDYAIKDFYKYNNPTIYRWRDLFEKSEFPFIKCSLLRLQNYLHTTVDGWENYFSDSQLNMIYSNLAYTSREKPMKCISPRWLKIFVFNHLPNKKMKSRMITRALLRTVLSFLTD